jgi:PAS domain S-box-containing protein
MPSAHRILVVDDEERIRKSLSGLLHDHGYEAATAVSGSECLQIMSAQDFDLVILDIIMPEMNGVEVLQKIKEKYKDVEVIIITGHADKKKAIDTFRLGAYDFIEKPFESREILNTIAYRLNQLDLRKERKWAENALRESEERYRRMVSAVTAYTYSVEVSEGQAVSTQHSMGCLPITGYSPEDYESDPYLWYSMIHPDDRMIVDNSIKEILAERKVFPIEHRLIRRDGSIVWVRNTMVPYYDNGGRLIRYDGLIEDITTRKQVEEALWESEQKYRDLYDNAPDMYHTLDKNGIIIDCNETEARMLGYEKEEIIGRPVTDFFTEDSKRLFKNDFPRLNKESKLSNIVREFVRKDGTTFPSMLNVFSEYDENGEFIRAKTISRDITARKKLEEQLLHSQKIEAIGQLAGGIAHDFNNILTAIIGFGNLLKMETVEDDPLRSYVTHILTSAERAISLTQALLAFSRKQIINPKPVDLNEIIRGVEKLLSRLIGEDIELSTVLTGKDLNAMADIGQIEQVLMNLATNARDAMPDGGSLIIKTDLVQFDSEFIKAHGYGKPGLYALISVEDTGEGMDEETKERIFEPFFTTKEVGKGTGLGLSMVHGIIQQHNGYINVYSELGRGTIFKIYFPLIMLPVEEGKEAILPTIQRGTETVLVAEDDAHVRELIKEVLAGFGYTVVEAVDGEDALQVFHEHKDRIQLVIFDVVMPKKNGKEVYDEIKKIQPDIKAIFISGYDANIIHKKGILEEGLQFISKPILPVEILKKLREVLDKKDTK